MSAFCYIPPDWHSLHPLQIVKARSIHGSTNELHGILLSSTNDEAIICDRNNRKHTIYRWSHYIMSVYRDDTTLRLIIHYDYKQIFTCRSMGNTNNSKKT